MFVVSAARPMEALFGDLSPLVEGSILLKVELGDLRRASERRRPNHVALPYFVPWLPRDESTRKASEGGDGRRFSVCLEASSHGGRVGRVRGQIARTLRQYPGALVRTVDAARRSRSLLCGSRRRMRTCQFCLIPHGHATPSSRRFYEALATKCVPVLLADRFVLPFEGSAVGTSGGGGLLPPHAIDSFVLRVAEANVPQLPKLLDQARLKYDRMLKNLLAYRTAYLYELPRDGDPSAGGTVCAVVAEVARRFGPHLHSWRTAGIGDPDLSQRGRSTSSNRHINASR